MPWEVKKLSEICSFQNGFAFKSNTYRENGSPILRITNIQDQNIDVNNVVYFNPNDYKEDFSKYKVLNGDLVIAMSGATTGKLGLNNSDIVFYLNQRVGKFIPKKELDKYFLYYFLLTKVEENLKIAAGAAQPNLSTEQINNFLIPCPSLSEQKQIVAILDSAFEKIEKAKKNAEQNLGNSKKILENYLLDIFNTNNAKCATKKLNEICTKQSSNISQNKLDNESGVYPIYGASGLIKNISYYNQKDHYIAIVKDGAGIGRLFLLPPKSSIIGTLQYLIPNEEINIRYLFYFLSVINFNKYKFGSTIPHIYFKDYGKEMVLLPSQKEQQEIVNKLDKLSAETKKLEVIYEKKLADLEELKKSILEKAFKGELTKVIV